jgi:hypothetical protein
MVSALAHHISPTGSFRRRACQRLGMAGTCPAEAGEFLLVGFRLWLLVDGGGQVVVGLWRWVG